jgi:hypothetical protein
MSQMFADQDDEFELDDVPALVRKHSSALLSGMGLSDSRSPNMSGMRGTS